MARRLPPGNFEQLPRLPFLETCQHAQDLQRMTSVETDLKGPLLELARHYDMELSESDVSEREWRLQRMQHVEEGSFRAIIRDARNARLNEHQKTRCPIAYE